MRWRSYIGWVGLCPSPLAAFSQVACSRRCLHRRRALRLCFRLRGFIGGPVFPPVGGPKMLRHGHRGPVWAASVAVGGEGRKPSTIANSRATLTRAEMNFAAAPRFLSLGRSDLQHERRSTSPSSALSGCGSTTGGNCAPSSGAYFFKIIYLVTLSLLLSFHVKWARTMTDHH